MTAEDYPDTLKLQEEFDNAFYCVRFLKHMVWLVYVLVMLLQRMKQLINGILFVRHLM